MTAAPRRAAYLDLDGTLLGSDGRVVAETLETVAVLRAAGWTPVLLTGRSRAVAAAVGRLLGVDDVVCEPGAVVLADGREQRTRPRDGEGLPLPGRAPRRPTADAVLAAIDRGGGCRAEEHEPGASRDGGHVLRVAGPAADAVGALSVDADVPAPEGGPVAAAVTRALAASGLVAWRAVDNGPSHLPLADGAPARVVHVVPRGVDKRAGVLEHRELRGVARRDAVALGDGPADLDAAPAVGRFLLVAGDPTATARAATLGVTVTRSVAAVGALEAARAIVAGG